MRTFSRLFPALLLLSTGCVTREVIVERPVPAYRPPPPPPPVVSVYVDPPMGQPEPIGCPWAPPPMLVEAPPPPPFEGAFWTGGYWVWEGTWVWAHGRWVGAPQPGWGWHQPYYENRGGTVVFIGGFWAQPGVVFRPPPPGISITVVAASPGVIPGPRPMGPEGVFVPPPPGSRAGLIVPAPIGTPPAVVTSAPPVVNVGMRIRSNVNVNSNNTTVVNNTTNITNVTNVIVEAPASATASGKAVSTTVPAQAHLAAAMHPVVSAPAPTPASEKAIPAFRSGRGPVALPPAQPVHVAAPPRPAAQAPALHAPRPAEPAPARREDAPPPTRENPREAPPKKKEKANPRKVWRDQDKPKENRRDD